VIPGGRGVWAGGRNLGGRRLAVAGRGRPRSGGWPVVPRVLGRPLRLVICQRCLP